MCKKDSKGPVDDALSVSLDAISIILHGAESRLKHVCNIHDSHHPHSAKMQSVDFSWYFTLISYRLLSANMLFPLVCLAETPTTTFENLKYDGAFTKWLAAVHEWCLMAHVGRFLSKL